MKPLTTGRLILRNWEERDRDLFHFINSDPRVMEFFPFRRDRPASDAMMDRLAAEIRREGFGFAAIEIADTGQTAGFAGLHRTAGVDCLPESTIEIGWRLAPAHWGKGIATEAARAWLAHGFGPLGLARIVSFAVAGNHRSIAVMRRIGMRACPDRDFDHPAVPDSRPELKRHVLYEMTAEAFAQLPPGSGR